MDLWRRLRSRWSQPACPICQERLTLPDGAKLGDTLECPGCHEALIIESLSPAVIAAALIDDILEGPDFSVRSYFQSRHWY